MSDKHSELIALRQYIDNLDEELLQLLARRMQSVQKVGTYKKERGMPPLDQQRWQSLLEKRRAQAQELHLSEEFVTHLFELIHAYALKLETEDHL